MVESDEEFALHQNPKWKKHSIASYLVSLVSVSVTQFTFTLLPLFLPASSFLTLLPLSAVLLLIVVGFGRICKRVAGVRASAPAFVFLTIFFIWAVYLSVVRGAISSLVDVVFNVEIIVVIVGLYRIMSLDPGFVAHNSSGHDLFVQNPLSEVDTQGEVVTANRSAKYCKYCKNYVLGFDHHCPAFGNCIGQRNHVLFLVLLVGFVLSEASYVRCASQFTAKSQTLNEDGREEIKTSRNLVLGTMLFCLIQVLWQVVFILWHVYCACFNIKTDEWINWEKYPEFKDKVISRTGQEHSGTQFTNPYDKGIVMNLKEFLTAK
ncbi:hypothetical protein ABFS83_14G251500 [Erythranthe nasuta]